MKYVQKMSRITEKIHMGFHEDITMHHFSCWTKKRRIVGVFISIVPFTLPQIFPTLSIRHEYKNPFNIWLQRVSDTP